MSDDPNKDSGQQKSPEQIAEDKAKIEQILNELRPIKDQIIGYERQVAENAAQVQARSTWITNLVPSSEQEIELNIQQALADQSAERVKAIADMAAKTLTNATATFNEADLAQTSANVTAVEQARESLNRALDNVKTAVTDSQAEVKRVSDILIEAKKYASVPIWGKWLEAKRTQWQGPVQIIITAVVIILVFILINSLINSQVAGVYLIIVVSVILISIGFYRPQRVRTRSVSQYTPSSATTEKIPEPSLPFTHPAVLLLGVYLVVFALISLGLVVQLGTEITIPYDGTQGPEVTPTATPPAQSTAEATVENQAFLAAEATPEITPTPAPSSTPTTSGTATPKRPLEYPVYLLYWKINVTADTRLLLLIVLSGALGGLLKGLQSYRWYLGERNFKPSWISYYITEPFVGGILALLFYVLIRGGFFNAQTIETTATNNYGLVATSGLIGLFSNQAIKKLKQLAETLFAPSVGENPTTEDQAKIEAAKKALVTNPPTTPPATPPAENTTQTPQS